MVVSVLIAVVGASKAHAAMCIKMELGGDPRALDQCRAFGTGARRTASVRSARHDNPSKRQKVTTLVSPHSSQASFSSPSM
jgi:ribosomal protein S10